MKSTYIMRIVTVDYKYWSFEVFWKFYNTVIENRTFQALQSILARNFVMHNIDCSYDIHLHIITWKLPIMKFWVDFWIFYNTVIQNRTFQALQSILVRNNVMHDIDFCYDIHLHYAYYNMKITNIKVLRRFLDLLQYSDPN